MFKRRQIRVLAGLGMAWFAQTAALADAATELVIRNPTRTSCVLWNRQLHAGGISIRSEGADGTVRTLEYADGLEVPAFLVGARSTVTIDFLDPDGEKNRMFYLVGKGDGREGILYIQHKVNGPLGRELKVNSRMPTRFKQEDDHTILVGEAPGILETLGGLCTIL